MITSIMSMLPFTKAGKKRRARLDEALSAYRRALGEIDESTRVIKESTRKMCLVQQVLQSF